MREWTCDDLMTKPCAVLNGHVLDLQPLRGRALGKPGARREVPEAELQRKCEAFLETQGFKRLAAKNAARPAAGWFGHLNKPEGNPFLPDLMLFHEPNDRPALLVELKTADRFQTGQREMCERGAWTLCWSFVEFVQAFTQWIKTGGQDDGSSEDQSV